MSKENQPKKELTQDIFWERFSTVINEEFQNANRKIDPRILLSKPLDKNKLFKGLITILDQNQIDLEQFIVTAGQFAGLPADHPARIMAAFFTHWYNKSLIRTATEFELEPLPSTSEAGLEFVEESKRIAEERGIDISSGNFYEIPSENSIVMHSQTPVLSAIFQAHADLIDRSIALDTDFDPVTRQALVHRIHYPSMVLCELYAREVQSAQLGDLGL